jgi:hypothetical protein
MHHFGCWLLAWGLGLLAVLLVLEWWFFREVTP